MAAKFEVSSAKHAFVSYVAEDKVRVDKLCRVLDAANVPYWRDRKRWVQEKSGSGQFAKPSVRGRWSSWRASRIGLAPSKKAI